MRCGVRLKRRAGRSEKTGPTGCDEIAMPSTFLRDPRRTCPRIRKIARLPSRPPPAQVSSGPTIALGADTKAAGNGRSLLFPERSEPPECYATVLVAVSAARWHPRPLPPRRGVERDWIACTWRPNSGSAFRCPPLRRGVPSALCADQIGPAEATCLYDHVASTIASKSASPGRLSG